VKPQYRGVHWKHRGAKIAQSEPIDDLPDSLKPLPLKHLNAVKKLHDQDFRRGDEKVCLPYVFCSIAHLHES
jgi:hypothetical protein